MWSHRLFYEKDELMKTLLAVAALMISLGLFTQAAQAQCGCEQSATYAPVATTAYYAPTTTYYAPTTAYYASTTTYYAPTTAYYAPAVTTYYVPTTAYYPTTTAYDYPGSVGRPGLFGGRLRRAYRRGDIMTTQPY